MLKGWLVGLMICIAASVEAQNNWQLLVRVQELTIPNELGFKPVPIVANVVLYLKDGRVFPTTSNSDGKVVLQRPSKPVGSHIETSYKSRYVLVDSEWYHVSEYRWTQDRIPKDGIIINYRDINLFTTLRNKYRNKGDTSTHYTTRRQFEALHKRHGGGGNAYFPWKSFTTLSVSANRLLDTLLTGAFSFPDNQRHKPLQKAYQHYFNGHMDSAYYFIKKIAPGDHSYFSFLLHAYLSENQLLLTEKPEFYKEAAYNYLGAWNMSALKDTFSFRRYMEFIRRGGFLISPNDLPPFENLILKSYRMYNADTSQLNLTVMLLGNYADLTISDSATKYRQKIIDLAPAILRAGSNDSRWELINAAWIESRRHPDSLAGLRKVITLYESVDIADRDIFYPSITNSYFKMAAEYQKNVSKADSALLYYGTVARIYRSLVNHGDNGYKYYFDLKDFYKKIDTSFGKIPPARMLQFFKDEKIRTEQVLNVFQSGSRLLGLGQDVSDVLDELINKTAQ
jgi:hypothetical protein